MSLTQQSLIPPGSTIGILGGGQLGRMLSQAAARLGYRVHIFEPEPDGPAEAVSAHVVNAPYENLVALREFARRCDVITYEFENIPAASLRAIEEIAPQYPHWRVLETTQNRSREKQWLRGQGFAHARYVEVAAGGDLPDAIRSVGMPCVVKSTDWGYDGKGQRKVRGEEDLPAVLRDYAERSCVIEEWIDFACEISVVVARSSAGECRTFPVAENRHEDHILDVSLVPALVSPLAAETAERMARQIAVAIGLVGVLAVEFFVTRSGTVLVNELAPRPHNSGHYTIDACATSQFEQQVRAVCGLPLGDTRLLSPVAMVNLLGDAWFLPETKNGTSRREPDWPALLREPTARLHLYGKTEPRMRRKMGHFTVLADSAEEALVRADRLRQRL